MELWDVAVIGAGPAGMSAAATAAKAGARTLVLERKARPGRKLALTGGGRCNFTNALPAHKFLRSFGDENARKLGAAFRAFSNRDLLQMLSARGVAAREESDGRIFTASGRAEDVVDAWRKEVSEAGAEMVTSATVTHCTRNADGTFRLEADFRRTFFARALILCTGGVSYPETGSTGAGFEWLRRLGIKTTPLRPALVGLQTREAWPKELSGTACSKVALKLRCVTQGERKIVAGECGELLFAHFGVSGPAVLNLSGIFTAADSPDSILEIDFLPDFSTEALKAAFEERQRTQPKAKISGGLQGLLPEKLLKKLVVLALAAETENVVEPPATNLRASTRQRLLNVLKSTQLTPIGVRDSRLAEVTAGGVAWEELDEKTMSLRAVPGLFCAGELLDLAGRCGGFNLQAAFSTGFLAGFQAAKFARSRQNVARP